MVDALKNSVPSFSPMECSVLFRELDEAQNRDNLGMDTNLEAADRNV